MTTAIRERWHSALVRSSIATPTEQEWVIYHGGSGSVTKTTSATPISGPTGLVYSIVGSALPLSAFISISMLSGGFTAPQPTATRTSSAAVVGPVVRRRSEDEEVANGDSGRSANVSSATNVSVSAITASEQLRAIQTALSLTITEIAEIHGVTRATIYGWMKSDAAYPRENSKADRMRELHRVAKKLRALTPETLGRMIAAPIADDRPSLLTLLRADSWDAVAIDETVKLLAQHLDRLAEERSRFSESSIGVVKITAENIEIERLRLRGIG